MDRGRKRELYARFGMPFYWIADDEAQAIESRSAHPSGPRMIAAEPFPGLTLLDIWP